MKTPALLSLVFALTMCAQATEAPLGSVAGQVVGSGGTPLPGVKVTLGIDLEAIMAQKLPPPRFGVKPVTTDDRGKFTIDGVPAGVYTLSAELAGYLRQPYGGKPGARSGSPIVVQEGDKISNLAIRMSQQSAISGRIRNKKGEPVESVVVHAVRWTYTGGVRQLTEEGKSSASNSDGEFRISELIPGRYFVYASPTLEVRSFAEMERITLPTFYPDSSVVADAIPIDIVSGSDGFADIQLREDPQFTIRGTVGGVSPAGATVLIMEDAATPMLARAGNFSRSSPPYIAIASADEQGRFELSGVVPGLHRLLAFGRGKVPINFGSRGSVTLNGAASSDEGAMGTVDVRILDKDVSDVKIALRPGGEITRKISLEGSTFDEWLRAGFKKNGTPAEQVQQRMSLMAGFTPPVALIPEQRVSVGGRFPDVPQSGTSTQKVSPGRYFVSVTGVQQLYIKTIRLGGEDVTGKELNFTGGTSDLEIVMAEDGGAVSGSLKDADGNVLSGRTVSLWPVETDLSQQNGGAKAATSSYDGSFTFFNLAPGRYYLAAFDDLPDTGLGQYPPFLAQFTAGNEFVRVEAEKTATRPVKVISRRDVDRALANVQ